jgi:hypothetical protein
MHARHQAAARHRRGRGLTTLRDATWIAGCDRCRSLSPVVDPVQADGTRDARRDRLAIAIVRMGAISR